MKAITIWQPWASWIAWGWKKIETRSHNRLAYLKGQRIAIHAGKRWDDAAFEVAENFMKPEMVKAHKNAVISRGYPFGAILATAFVWTAESCLECDCFDALCDTSDCYGLFLRDIKAQKEPIPCRGFQGVFEVDRDIAFMLERGMELPGVKK